MKIYRNGPRGNAHMVMARVRELLEATGRKAELPSVMARMRSGDYENLVAVAKEVSFGSIEVVDDEMEADT